MGNIARVLKAEISRISRKEVKTAIGGIAESARGLKKSVAALKRRVAFLEKENKRLMATQAKQRPAAPAIPAEEGKRARLTSKGIRSLRNRLRLKRPAFARLLGTTAQTVYLWETKEGALKLRDKTKAALLSIRGLGAREVKRRLAQK